MKELIGELGAKMLWWYLWKIDPKHDSPLKKELRYFIYGKQ
jgi:hypothetical protein